MPEPLVLLWAGLGTGAVPGTPSPALPRVAAVPVTPSHSCVSRCSQMAYSQSAPQLTAGGDLAETLCPRWHGQGHVLPLTISSCCLPVPQQGLAVPPCHSLAHHSAAALLPSASGLLPHLQVTFSALQPLFWGLGQFLHGSVVHWWLSQHCSSAVMVTSVYLLICFHGS